jgi:hypothetical protein
MLATKGRAGSNDRMPYNVSVATCLLLEMVPL